MAELLVMDVGGTSVKYGLADEKGQLLPQTVRQTPARADGTADEILDVFRGIVTEAVQEAGIRKVCAATAGPFDFDKGVFLMRHKFPALYGHSLKELFSSFGLSSLFLHDSTAFLLGEASSGGLRDVSDACCVMLGTGLGFAVMRNRKVLLDESRTAALHLWRMPWEGGIMEDFVSTRALQRLYGAEIPIRELAALARQGNERALNAFRETGKTLSRIADKLIRVFPCQRFALGGQIAKSADLFALSLSVPWYACPHPENTALLGACFYALHGPAGSTEILTADAIQTLEREVLTP